ncbi:MAG: helix-turn-helix transcriptional regulator, partial [Pyrinomonadaceae bacterium]
MAFTMSTKILDESSLSSDDGNISLSVVQTGRAIKEDLADYLRRIRNEKGLSLRDVEVKSGSKISKGYVGQIENRSVLGQSVTPQKLQALSVGLGVSEDEIF